MTKIGCGILLFFLSSSAFAVVDVRNGNYFRKVVDLENPQLGFDGLSLSYNSQSRFSGLFGLGWCSNMETRLEVVNDSAIRIHDCGGGRVSTFSKVKNKKQDYIGPSGQKIKFGNGQYQRIQASRRQFFDTKGRLVKVRGANRLDLQMKYDGKGRLAKISSSFGGNLKISYSIKGDRLLVQPSWTKKNLKIVKRRGLLASLRTSDGKQERYSYQRKTRKLTRIQYPNKESERVTYKGQKVSHFHHRNQCRESYTYKSSVKKGIVLTETSAQLRCPGQKSKFRKYQARRRRRGGKLISVVSNLFGPDVSISFSKKNGLPLTAQTKGYRDSFRYKKKGYERVRKLKSGKLLHAEYDWKRRIRKLNRYQLGMKIDSVRYNYDKSGRLANLASRSGTSFSLTYNNKGLLSKITKNGRGGRILNLATRSPASGRVFSINPRKQREDYRVYSEFRELVEGL